MKRSDPRCHKSRSGGSKLFAGASAIAGEKLANALIENEVIKANTARVRAGAFVLFSVISPGACAYWKESDGRINEMVASGNQLAKSSTGCDAS